MHPSTAMVPPPHARHRGTLPRAAWLAGGLMIAVLLALGYGLSMREQPAAVPAGVDASAPSALSASTPPPPARASAPTRAANAPLPAPARKPPPVAGERRASSPQAASVPAPGRKPPPVQGGRPPPVAGSV